LSNPFLKKKLEDLPSSKLHNSLRPSTQTPSQLTTPPSYVLLAATSYVVLNALHASNTSRFRKAASVPYPQAYAPSSRTDAAAHRFNCAQRAHANYIENSPSFLVALVLAGLRYPVWAGALGMGWCVARWLYMQGYSTGAERGKGRYRGIWFYLPHYSLVGLCAFSGVQMIRGL
jgi:glutathione S-transferase